VKVGIVGVGPWGRILAATFERNGHVVAAHDRRDKSKIVGDMGELVPWQDMIDSKRVDAIACAAPPDTTKAVFDACQARRMPCLLTKPFLISKPPKDLTAPTYVDYVHLASPVYEKLKKSATRDYEILRMEVSFYGCGPDRSFSSLFDYGAHALAIVHDILGLGPLEVSHASSFRQLPSSKDEGGGGRQLIRAVLETKKNVKTDVFVGNGSPGSKRRVEVWLARGPRVAYEEDKRVATFEIDGKVVTRMPGHDPLSLMVDRFAWDIDVGRINPYFVELSAAVTRSLEAIQDAARGQGGDGSP